MFVQKLEMGYCPNCVVTKGLGSWALGAGGRGTALGALAEPGGRHRAGPMGHAARALGARSGRAAGLQAVHLVHSACF